MGVMSVTCLTPSTQNYLKAIWVQQEWSTERVTTSDIAALLGLKASTVSDGIRRLTEQGLVHHERYGSISLTGRGRTHAVAMVRRHRLVETLLVRTFGYRWDEVHDEAEALEHAVSDVFVERIDEFLGWPTRDPHGDPIPAADGTVQPVPAQPLTAAIPGSRVRVVRISDADPALLAYCAQHGVVIDAVLQVLTSAPYSETVALRVVGRDGVANGDGVVAGNPADRPASPASSPALSGDLTLGPSAAVAVWVSPVS